MNSHLHAALNDTVARIVSTANTNFCAGNMGSLQRYAFTAFVRGELEDLIHEAQTKKPTAAYLDNVPRSQGGDGV